MATSRAISRQSLPDAIAQDLRERILNGELAEGETIRQSTLAEEYNVSRMPAREALRRLDAEGLVHLTTNRGATVTLHSLAEIAEIFDLRAMLEVDLFRRAIPQMTPQDFALCDRLLSDMEQSYSDDDVGRWGGLNHDYHTALYAAASRQLTNDLLQRIALHSDRYIRIHLSVMQQLEPAELEHRQLLELARAGQVDEACAALRHHIKRSKGQLLDLITKARHRDSG